MESRILGVESNISSFAHVQLDESAHIEITGSWFHHGIDYGSGGRAYGVLCQLATNLCMVSNNIFNNLRHSMILQSGANGNVFAYNYSTSPFQSDSPLSPDFSGDLVIHGNYVFANLFEGNQVSHLIMDDSHGQNGPGNTFLRNRINGLGITIMNGNNSQNFVGNEVVSNKTYQGIAVPNWNITGSGHYFYGNKIKPVDGSSIYITQQPGTTVNDNSYFYPSKPPYFALTDVWPVYGTNNSPDSDISNDAVKRYFLPEKTICKIITDPLPVTLINFEIKADECNISLDWNTAEEINFSHFNMECSQNGIQFYEIGKIPAKGSNNHYNFTDLNAWNGINYYRLRMVDNNGQNKYSRIETAKLDCLKKEIFVFPAITKDKITINRLNAKETIRIYNASGINLEQKIALQSEESIDLTSYPTGLYLVIISNEMGKTVTFKVTKTN